MAKIDISVKILRYLPGKDAKPRWQLFKLAIEDEATILDVLNEIHWQHDGTLSYRRSCRSSICGSCAMKVNGRNVLACETPIHRFGTKIENRTVVRIRHHQGPGRRPGAVSSRN